MRGFAETFLQANCLEKYLFYQDQKIDITFFGKQKEFKNHIFKIQFSMIFAQTVFTQFVNLQISHFYDNQCILPKLSYVP